MHTWRAIVDTAGATLVVHTLEVVVAPRNPHDFHREADPQQASDVTDVVVARNDFLEEILGTIEDANERQRDQRSEKLGEEAGGAKVWPRWLEPVAAHASSTRSSLPDEASSRIAASRVTRAALVTADAILTWSEALVWNLPRAQGLGDWIVAGVACAAPSVAAAILWGAIGHRAWMKRDAPAVG